MRNVAQEFLPEAAAVNGAIQLTARVASRMRDAAKDAQSSPLYAAGNSLTDVANVARVEPITMIDSDVSNLEYVSDITQTLHSMFTGYYLQAVNMAGTIGGVTVAERLAPFNPNRPGFESLREFASAIKNGLNPLKHRLPLSWHRKSPALEEVKEAKDKAEKLGPPSMKADLKDPNKLIQEAAALSVGKMFNVAIRVNEVSVNVPVAIRLLVNILPVQQMVDLFTFRDSFDMDMKERFHAWRSGRLAFWKDLVLCNDLIDKYRRAAIKDKSGLTEQMLNRESNHIFSSLTSDKVSYATATNLAMMSTDTLAEIETRLNGQFANSKVRQALFESTNLMILAVVDKHWEMVTFYTRGIAESSQLHVRELRAANKGNGPDVTDIMKAYMLGNTGL